MSGLREAQEFLSKIENEAIMSGHRRIRSIALRLKSEAMFWKGLGLRKEYSSQLLSEAEKLWDRYSRMPGAQMDISENDIALTKWLVGYSHEPRCNQELIEGLTESQQHSLRRIMHHRISTEFEIQTGKGSHWNLIFEVIGGSPFGLQMSPTIQEKAMQVGSKVVYTGLAFGQASPEVMREKMAVEEEILSFFLGEFEK